MIKFFRKIRQEMLIKNKFNTYLLYAIGEIILVVIGILIALSINNWTNSIKDNNIELKALKDLRKEILSNHANILRHVNEKKHALESNKKFIESMRLNIVNSKSIIRSYGANTINPTHGVLNSLLSTGKIDNIKNDSLKELLINWKDLVNNYREEEERHFNWLDIIVWPYLNEVIPKMNITKQEVGYFMTQKRFYYIMNPHSKIFDFVIIILKIKKPLTL